MRPWREFTVCLVAIYVAAACEQALSRWTLLGGRFDYLILALSVLCIFRRRSGGAVVGFFCGWVYGSIVGANMWQYVLSRTAAGFLIAWVADAGIERSMLSAAIAGFVGVLLCQGLLMFLAPPPQITPFLGDTIRTAVYNGVLAMPLYAVINRILGPRR